MSITFGFYNSVNNDRRYDALQMSSIFDGIIRDGIFMSIGEAMTVKAASGMTVNVGEGKAWFDHTWTLNDSKFPVTLAASELLLDRIDTIVLDIDHRESVRANSIVVLKGTPATNPYAPTLIRSANRNQYPLCNIYVEAGITEITQANITNLVGTGSCPFVTGIIESVNIEDLVSQWEGQWNDWFAAQSANVDRDMTTWMYDTAHYFDHWFEDLQHTLSGDVATDLANRIIGLENRLSILRPEMHRNIFRGMCLGSSVTVAQKAAIRNGTFDNLYVGDFWTIGGVHWRIVDINYWWNRGNLNQHFSTPHLVIMPDEPLYDAQMNEGVGTTIGGYVGSDMYTTNLANAKTIVANAFGDMVLTHREYLVNSAAGGRPSSGAWYASTVELPNEIMMYGFYLLTPAVDGSESITRHTNSKTQLALFKLVPKFITVINDNYWLRDVVSSTNFACVISSGLASAVSSSSSYGVRPVFAIG